MLNCRIVLLTLTCWIGFHNCFAQNVKVVLPACHTEKILDVNFSLDEQMMATASEDNSVKIWSTVNGKLVQELKGHTKEVFKVYFYPDSKRILTASHDHTIRIWDLYSAKPLFEYSAPDGIHEVFLTRDGKRIILITPGNIINLNSETAKENYSI